MFQREKRLLSLFAACEGAHVDSDFVARLTVVQPLRHDATIDLDGSFEVALNVCTQRLGYDRFARWQTIDDFRIALTADRT